MKHEEIVRRVNELMQTGFEIPPEKLKPSTHLFDELGLDSLDAVDMLVHLEVGFGIKVEGERLVKVRTLQDVYSLVAEVAGKTPSRRRHAEASQDSN